MCVGGWVGVGVCVLLYIYTNKNQYHNTIIAHIDDTTQN